MTRDKLLTLINESVSKSEICRKLNIPINGTSFRKLNKWIREFNVSTSHFTQKLACQKFNQKFPTINVVCPVCSSIFETKFGHSKEKTTCSYSCANSFFKKQRKPTNYRSICFLNHEKKCLICGFLKIVEVHHLDENHENNEVKNLIPLCPNHHRMYHSYKWKKEVKDAIYEILN